jgi:hypothetical protein
MSWLEISLTVNGELAEAVADVLARFAQNGVVTEQGVDFIDEEDEAQRPARSSCVPILQTNTSKKRVRSSKSPCFTWV